MSAMMVETSTPTQTYTTQESKWADDYHVDGMTHGTPPATLDVAAEIALERLETQMLLPIDQEVPAT